MKFEKDTKVRIGDYGGPGSGKNGIIKTVCADNKYIVETYDNQTIHISGLYLEKI